MSGNQRLGMVMAAVSFSLFAGIAHAQDPTRDYVPGEVLVKLKSRPSEPGARRFFNKVTSQKGMALKRSWSGINMHKFAMKSDAGSIAAGQPQDMQSLINELAADPEVEFVEPNYYVRSQSLGVEPQRLSMDDVQTLAASGTFTQSNAPIGAQQAWSVVTNTSETPVVAVIDTGVDYTHPVFVQAGAIWSNANEVAGNGIDDDGNGYVDDMRGWNFVTNSNDPMDDDDHGTHVAGIILGVTQDIRAATVTAAKIRIMPLKFLGNDGVGSTSDAVEAIYYAANNGAKVMNNSWGGGGYSQALVNAIAYAYEKKVVFVAAAGNAANNNDVAPTYPASYAFANLISVAATSDYDALANFSNYGATSVHMGSPGVGILSTLPGSTWGYSTGTSMATPFVAGVAALMLREKPTMNGYQIRQLIFSSNETITSLNGKTSTGSRLNAYNSVQKAMTTSVNAYMPAYDPGSNRGPASSAKANPAPAGCGLVAKSLWDAKGNGSGPDANPLRNTAFFGLLLVLLAPVIISLYMRQTAGHNKRVHDRYQIDSQVRVRIGDRELVGNVSSISLGGVQLNTDAWLEHGGVVTMQIASPDGQDTIKVEGRVVWCEEQKRYGVAFQNAEQPALAAITRWTRSLVKT